LDTNGWPSQYVKDYQSYYGSGVNCSVTLYQGMLMSCGNDWENYTEVPGPFGTYSGIPSSNTLTYTIKSTTEVNERVEFSGEKVSATEPPPP
jgi:hypothetical protein